jgi:hypothetical protein
MLLMEETTTITGRTASVPDQEDTETAEVLIRNLQQSNRELARQLAVMKESKDFYKELYEKLIDAILATRNRGE